MGEARGHHGPPGNRAPTRPDHWSATNDTCPISSGQLHGTCSQATLRQVTSDCKSLFSLGRGINYHISPMLCSLQYATIGNAVEITSLGRHTQLLMLDLINTYCIIPVHPDDQPLLIINWNGRVFVDQALPFGLRSAPKIFSAMADMLT